MSGIQEIVDGAVDSNSQAINNSQINSDISNQNTTNQEGISDNNSSNQENQNNNENIKNQDNNENIEKKIEEKITPEMYYNRVEEVRRLQSERDKAEAYIRKLLENVIQYVDIDEQGNVIGLKQNKQNEINSLYERAAMGDVEAVRKINELVKEEAKKEALREFLTIQNIEATKNKIVNEIRQEFSDLIDENGNINPNNPIWEEASNIVNKERVGVYDLSNPYHLKTVLEIARGRVLMKAYPELKREIKKEVVNEVRKAGAMSTASPMGATKEENDIALSQEQLNILRKSGRDTPDDLRRISNIIRQVKNGMFELQ